MTELNNRQRITANSCLSMIALHNYDPGPVQQAAKQLMANGTPGNQAYSKALEDFASRVPAIRETLSTVIALITNSDEPTLASYDDAVTHFNDTGDNSKLDALGPMIVDDFKALLVRTGQATAEEVAALEWDASDALGLDEAAISPEPWQPAPEQLAPADEQANQSQGTEMTALNPKQYGEALRELRSRVKGNIEDSPEYAQLQARAALSPAANTGPAAPTGMPKAEVRNGQPYIPGYWTPTGYRAAVTGDRAREANGVPVLDTSGV